VIIPNAAGGRPYDFSLTVIQHIGAGGPIMGLWPHVPPGMHEAEEPKHLERAAA
jgi:hypothetical protein